MKYEIILAPEARHDLESLGAYDRARVKDSIEKHLRHTPTKVSKSRIKKLRGLRHPQYRLRVDDVRIFFDVEDAVVQILAIIPKPRTAQWLKEVGEEI
ncbi:MAG: type II toxin-antitoxin system RelE family toxin [Dissulfurispiraceae bacterium]